MLKKQPLGNWIILVCLGMLPACYKRAQKQLTQHYDEQPALRNEAHLTDVPLPVQVTPRVLSGSTTQATGLTFVSNFQLDDLIKFYQFEMERLGWKEVHAFSVPPEVLLIFEKPEKFCTLSVRPDNRVVIFFGTRT